MFIILAMFIIVLVGFGAYTLYGSICDCREMNDRNAYMNNYDRREGIRKKYESFEHRVY